MGSYCSSEKVQPQEVSTTLHNIPLEQSNNVENLDNQLKDVNKQRRVTDVLFLLFSFGLLTCLGVLITYCILYGNIYRVLNGYNNCGDVCGVQNYMEDSKLLCKGEDLQKSPYLMIQYAYTKDMDINYLERSCVDNCESYPGFRQLLNRCIPKDDKFGVNTFISRLGIRNFFLEAREDLDTCWKEIIYMFIIAFILSLAIVILLRYFVGFVVWIVLIGVSLSCVIATIVGWILFVKYKDDLARKPSSALQATDRTKYYSYLAFALIATVVSICVILIIIVMRKRIQLVVQLFKEAGKAVAAMPLIIFQPLLTFIAITIAICCFLYFSLWIESAGFLTEITESLHNYEKNFIMHFTRWYNILIFLWMIQFIIGCQHMVIAGAVATWYFMRDKSKLGHPILYSTYNLMRYHIGSVAFGSFLISLVQFVRLLLFLVQRYLKNKEGKCFECLLKCCQCCLYVFETILKYITKNAYIEVAMYGHSFCIAGKQAFKLLVDNALRVTVINSVGDFVLLLAKVFVVAATVLIGIELIKDKEGVLHMWIPLAVAGIFAYFVSNCFLTVYEMAIDTIFLCFCEDCQQNDGINRSYFMSKGLMEFVDNSKKVLAYVDAFDKEVTKEAWREKREPPTISSKVTTT